MSEDEYEDISESDSFEFKDEDLSQKVDYDISFQQAILKLGLTDEHFCAQLVKYLGNDRDLKDFNIFDHEALNVIFVLMVNGYKAYQKLPSEGHIRQKIHEHKEEEKIKTLYAAFDAIMKADISDDIFYRKTIAGFIKTAKFAKFYKRIKTTWVDKGQDEAISQTQIYLDDIMSVNFEKDSIYKLTDFTQVYETNKNSGVSKIPTGLTNLDRDMLGGFSRQDLVVVLAGTNVGKTMFCISLGCNALKSKDEIGNNKGFKVFHINLEGNAKSVLFKYYANLAQIPYENIATGKLTAEEIERLKVVEETYKDQFMIKDMAGNFNNTIESVQAYCKEIYKKFKFDLLIVDYGQLLNSVRDSNNGYEAMKYVFRGLDTMSKAFDCVVVSPIQGTRGAQEKQNLNSGANKYFNKDKDTLPVMRSYDIADSIEIARVSAVIISLNATDEEKLQSRLRVFLEKQREGMKGTTYGLFTRYDLCDLITGKFYDPKATITKDQEAPEKPDSMNLFENKPKLITEAPQNKEEELDLLVSQFRQESKKEDNMRADYTIEKQKPSNERSDDILTQFAQTLKKHDAKKKEIIVQAQKLIKEIDADASEVKLKEFEKSAKDLIKEGRSQDNIDAVMKIIDRYRLGLRGKL